MAEIPVERKEGGGIPWWVWLLLAVLAALLIWWLMDDGDSDRNERIEPAGVEATQPVTTDTTTTQ